MRDASTVKTVKLYDAKPYASEFTAHVTGRDGAAVLLDRTLFFPEEGGQSPDRGTLGGFAVRDVQIKDGEILHYLSDEAEAARLSVGEEVCGRLDWEHRFSNMQQHSGEHLVSGLVNRMYGLDNVGFHLSDREVTLDFNGLLSAEQLAEVEREANRAVTSDVPSSVRFTTAEERRNLVYRSKLELEGEVRLVGFGDYDLCACCAPHVCRTGEIGLIKILGCASYKGGVRVRILCGARALAFVMREHEIVTEAAGLLTTGAEQIVPQLVKLKEETASLAARLRAYAAKSLDAEIAALPRDRRHAVLFAEELEMSAARAVVNRLAGMYPGFCGVFVGDDGEGYSFVLASGTEGGDAREALGWLRSAGEVRGGGRPEMVQGSLRVSEAEIRGIFEAV